MYRKQAQADENKPHSDRIRQGFHSPQRRNALMGGVVIGDMVDRLYAVHNALKANRASGELTDEQYTEKASELLEMFGRFDGIMTELVTDRPR